MRAIKFRAWDSKFGVMLNSVAPYGNDNIIVLDVEFNRAYGDNIDARVDAGIEEAGFEHVCITGNLVTMQYVGIKDNQGSEFCFDDIVKFQNDSIGVLVWMGDCLGIGSGEINNYYAIDQVRDIELSNCTIIGNIHENPELLA